MENITLWNGKTAPRIGIGTWVMGGEQYWNGKSTGWAGVDDNQSIATLHQAFGMGVRIIGRIQLVVAIVGLYLTLRLFPMLLLAFSTLAFFAGDCSRYRQWLAVLSHYAC